MIDSEVLFTILKVAGLFIGLSFLVFWVGLVWWVSQDVLTRTSDKIIIAAAVAMTAILGPVGIMLYLIIRPRQTMKESYGEMMEHEMMLRAAASTICPMCEHMTQEDFVNCPYCGTVLKKQCTGCQKLVDMDWSYCPYCGEVASRTDRKIVSPAPTAIDPEVLKELKGAREAQAIQQDALQRTKLEEAQKATFATPSIGRNLLPKKKITSASQSALDILRQTFSSAQSVTTTVAADSASTDVKTDQAESKTEVETKEEGAGKIAKDEKSEPKSTKASAAKKRSTSKTTKSRTTRRAKK